MTGLLRQIESALLEYFEAIELQKEGDVTKRPPLRPLFERLDQLASQLPTDMDGQLRHFMAQKSYQKALAHLQAQK